MAQEKLWNRRQLVGAIRELETKSGGDRFVTRLYILYTVVKIYVLVETKRLYKSAGRSLNLLNNLNNGVHGQS